MRHVIEDALRGLIHDLKAGRFSLGVTARKTQASPTEIRQILISCLLSSGWKYEKALNASALFSQQFPLNDKVPPLSEIQSFLSDSQVRHRFPKSKAKQLHFSLGQLSVFPVEMLFKGADVTGERIIRDLLQRKLAGFGYKQTSMFLRDIGASKNLAIIDSHIIWYLKNIIDIKITSVTRRKYIEIEDMIRNISMDFELDLNSFDVLLWVLVREFKKRERANSCGTQYVLPLAA